MIDVSPTTITSRQGPGYELSPAPPKTAWTGAGITLRTGTPTAGAVRAAVREVLNDPNYLRSARVLEAAFARRDGVAEIATLVDEVISERTTVGRR